MKKTLKPLFLSIFFLGFIAFAQTSLAQAPPPPPVDKGTNSNKGPGGGAPVDGGVIVTLAMLAGFSGWKMYRANQKNRDPFGQ